MKSCERCHWTTNETCRSCKAEMQTRQQTQRDAETFNEDYEHSINKLRMLRLTNRATEVTHKRLRAIQ